MNELQKIWLHRHGAPKYFSVDDEFCRRAMQALRSKHGIVMKPRPLRSSHNTGKVEGGNGDLNSVVERLEKPDGTASASTIVARVSS